MFKISKVPKRYNTYIITLTSPLKKASNPFRGLYFKPNSVVYVDSKLLKGKIRFSKFKIRNSKIDLNSEEFVNKLPKDIYLYANEIIKNMK